MKPSPGTLVAIVILSLAVWVFFYVMTPGAPLAAGDTIIVVAVSALLVLGGKWIWARLLKPGATSQGGKPEGKPGGQD